MYEINTDLFRRISQIKPVPVLARFVGNSRHPSGEVIGREEKHQKKYCCGNTNSFGITAGHGVIIPISTERNELIQQEDTLLACIPKECLYWHFQVRMVRQRCQDRLTAQAGIGINKP